LFIELDKKALAAAVVNFKDFREKHLNADAAELYDLVKDGKGKIKLDERKKKEENIDPGDYSRPCRVLIQVPDASIVPWVGYELPSDDSQSLDDIEEVRLPESQQAEEADSLFFERYLRFPVTVPVQHQAMPLPGLPKAHPPTDPEAVAIAEIRGYSKEDRIRKVITLAKQLNAKFKNTNNGEVAFDVDLIKAFRESEEAEELKKENDTVAHDIGYICFGIIFFFGSVVYDWAASLLFADPLLLRVYPADIGKL
jgi:hypothetical protein